MIIESASNPVFANAEQTIVTLTVVFEGREAVPFTATADDTEAHGRELHTRALAGEFGLVASYVAPVVTVRRSVEERIIDVMAKSGIITEEKKDEALAQLEIEKGK